MEMSKKVIIMIALPGAGKSTEAEVLKEACEAAGRTCDIHSTDDFFVDSWGEYKFDPSKLAMYHEMNRDSFERSLERGTDVVIVDNTNLQRRHREVYAELARDYDYEVHYRVIGSFGPTSCYAYAKRNKHNVPLGTIRRMANRYEPVTEEELQDGTLT